MKSQNCFSVVGKSLRVFSSVIVFFAIAISGNATTITWTNAAGGNWSNPLNWDPNQVPGQLNDPTNTDDVEINGFYHVTFDVGNVTNAWGIHSLTISGFGYLSLANASLDAAQVNISSYGELYCGVNSAVFAPINVGSSGQLGSYGRAAFYGPVTIAGTASIDGTTFYSSLTVSSGGNLTVISASSVLGPSMLAGKLTLQTGSLYVLGPLTNSGSIALVNSSYGGNAIDLYNNGTTNFNGSLLNLPGGSINLNNGTIQGQFGREYFINRGALTSMGGIVNVPVFDNTSGAVTNWAGTLDLGQFTNGFAGTFFSTNGAETSLSGGTAALPLAPGPAPSFNGGGSYEFISGYLLLTNNLIPNLDLGYGNLELGANFQGGAITNLTIDSMWLTNSPLPVTGTLTINGSTAQVFGGLTVLSGGVFNANAGTWHGPIEVASGGEMSMVESFLASDGSITVNGTLNILGSQIDGPITNFNTVNLTGPLFFYGSGTNTDDGIVNQPGAVMNFLPGGALRSGGGDSEFFVNSGTVTRGGDTNVSLIDLPNVTNSGSIIVQRGSLQFNQISLLPSSSLKVWLNSRTDYGRINVGSALALTGSFGATFTNGYWPAAGDAFLPLTFTSCSGSFLATNLTPAIPAQLNYGATNVTLVVGNPVPRFNSSLSAGGTMVFSGASGLPENPYWILATTNLSLPLAEWAVVASNQFDAGGNFVFTNSVAPSLPQQFFILETQ